ncbi:ATP-binding protein [Caedibacter taeniospiralis]|jgi:predicted AAA+ superfamily ATPase|uniref:ATP-binding protein n=1 Tax=Caedibacter taeniospiralis TaxID=28907 RepID=UPI0037C150E2
MIDFLWQTHHRLLANVQLRHKRFIYPQLDSTSRLMGIIGARGVGKTTLLLQHIRSNESLYRNSFYFSADNLYFNENSLLSVVDENYHKMNVRYFYIDEIHKYPNWNQELKNIYDAYPDVKVVFSGSSSIDLISGSYDLSRRAHMLTLPGLSFREYLNFTQNLDHPAIGFDELMNNHQSISGKLAGVPLLFEHFTQYLLYGYYPIVFELGQALLYDALQSVVEKTIYEDIAFHFHLKTSSLLQFKRILNFLASAPPAKAKTNTFATRLGIDNKTVDSYLQILEKTHLIKKLYAGGSGSQLLSKPDKLYLENTTMLAMINTLLSTDLDKGVLRELAFFQFVQGANLPIHYPKLGDFQIKEFIFEVGGKNKTGSQLASLSHNKYLVKDDLSIGYGNSIPLYLFGFLY